MGITHCAPPKATSIDPGAMRTSGASQQAIGMGATDEGPGSSPPHPPTPQPRRQHQRSPLFPALGRGTK